MKITGLFVLVWLAVLSSAPVWGAPTAAPLSEATAECLDCHTALHPGIVADWENSRHARTTPAAALQVKGLASKLSAESVPQDLAPVAVGCAECHGLRPGEHADTFEHNGHQVHVVVSPDDCKTCHSQEAGQYAENLMAHAYGNLMDNPLYGQLQRAILGTPVAGDGPAGLTATEPDALTRAEACLSCHGTRLEVTGTETRDTDAGELEFPVIAGWPNQGVGRLNLDGSRGACSACHTRHGFSMAMARKPHTCRQCHEGPDVPAYKVYAASKHGNIYNSHKADMDFDATPWTVGRDLTAPTCATCHVSLLVDGDDTVLAQRTHRMTDRLSWRLFGLVYAHPQPANPDVTTLRNADGLPLATDWEGNPAAEGLIDADQRAERTARMQAVCRSCHDTGWVRGHWQRLEHTLTTSNAAIRTATDLMRRIWADGLAQGPPAAGASPFDEAVERKWCDLWLFYGNTIRYAAAMAGGGDFGVYGNGRYQLTRGIQELADWHRVQLRLEGKAP